jgi:[acyl-carrier-protein] S-malonyltransferase
MGNPPPGAPRPRPVALLLPGQGAQHSGMAVGLYDREPAFTDALDEWFAALGAEGARVRSDWLSEDPRVPIDEATRAHPLLFGIEYAMGRMLQSWGVAIRALLGHSAGEYVAAVHAGVLSLTDAAGLLLERVAAFQTARPGGMLAVVATEEQVAPFLTDEVVVGAVNGPGQLLLAGPDPDLGAVEAALRAAEITCMPSKARRGFHSPSVVEACEATIPALSRVPLSAPRLELFSSHVPGLVDAVRARDPRFWAMIPAAPVLFGPGLDALLDRGDYLLIETGPGQGLAALARRHPRVIAGHSAVLALLGHKPGPPEADRKHLLRAVAGLVAEGYPVDAAVSERLTQEPAAAVAAGARTN